MRSFTQGVGGLKTQPSSIVSKAGLWVGAWAWASTADLCFPGRQRGLREGDKAARGGEAEAGRGGRGSLFPSGPVGSEHKREPRQSRQASPELWGFGPSASWGAGVGGPVRRQEAPRLSRSPLPSSLNRRQEGGAHPVSLSGKWPTWDAQHFPGNIPPVALSWTPRAAGHRAGRCADEERGRYGRRGWASPAGFRSPPLGAELRSLPGSSEKAWGGRVS